MKPKTTSEAIDNLRAEWRKLALVCIIEFKKDIQFIKNLFKRKRFDNTFNLYMFANKETAKKFSSERIEPNPPGSFTCPTCKGDGKAIFRRVDSWFEYEDTCQDCQGKGHVFQFTESVYEI